MQTATRIQQASDRVMAVARLAAAAILTVPLLFREETATARASATTAPVSVQWLRVDAHQPRTLYAGGTLSCPYSNDLGADPCIGIWAARSTDSGLTWSQLTEPMGLEPFQTGQLCNDSLDPFVVAADSAHLYAAIGEGCGGPHNAAAGFLRSADRGIHWQQTGLDESASDSWYSLLTISLLSTQRVYAVHWTDCDGCEIVVVSNDAGATWHDAGYAVPSGPFDVAKYSTLGLVADPVQPDTLYANRGAAGSKDPTLVVRSTDAGKSWIIVSKPVASPPLRTFAVGTDPHEPGLLVGRTFDPGVPANRRYLSADQGRTWRLAACPGTLAGACPAFTVDNIFGAGASYAFIDNGIYQFQAGGPAGRRLAIGDHLPLRTAQIIDVGAGTHQDDPIYLLGKGRAGAVQGVVYRSTDGGKSWQRLLAGMLPNLAPPSTTPGTLLVPATHHSVAAPFVVTYRRLGLQVIGYPLTEAYEEGDTLTQVFEHLRLELRGGRVIVAMLGRDVLLYQEAVGDPTLSDYQDGGGGVSPIPNSTTARYFPSTHHTLRGDLLRFWQQHGGMAVFGAPISEVVTDTNGDGSGRKYQMQYFANARLERHPENTDPRYAIELGLLGREWLQGRGWAVRS